MAGDRERVIPGRLIRRVDEGERETVAAVEAEEPQLELIATAQQVAALVGMEPLIERGPL